MWLRQVQNKREGILSGVLEEPLLCRRGEWDNTRVMEMNCKGRVRKLGHCGQFTLLSVSKNRNGGRGQATGDTLNCGLGGW